MPEACRVLLSVAAHIHKFLPLRDIESLYALSTDTTRQETTFVYRARMRSFLRRMEKIGAYHLRRRTMLKPALWEDYLLRIHRDLEKLEELRVGTLRFFEKLKTIGDYTP